MTLNYFKAFIFFRNCAFGRIVRYRDTSPHDTVRVSSEKVSRYDKISVNRFTSGEYNLTFQAIVSTSDNLHETSELVFRKKRSIFCRLLNPCTAEPGYTLHLQSVDPDQLAEAD